MVPGLADDAAFGTAEKSGAFIIGGDGGDGGGDSGSGGSGLNGKFILKYFTLEISNLKTYGASAGGSHEGKEKNKLKSHCSPGSIS